MIAAIFPGQGAQRVGMGKDLVETFPWAAEMAAATDRLLGRSLSEICFHGPEAELKKTTNTQPAIFFVSALLWEGAKRQGFAPQAVAGHSLGEYTALLAAGVASYLDLLRLVALRAEAMESACPAGQGAMAAVMMLPRDVLESICREAQQAHGPCVVANLNTPQQFVISGAAAAVQAASEAASAQGARRVIPLEVSGPFHSPLMEPARKRLADALAETSFRDAGIPVYTNVDGIPTASGAALKQKLIDQLTGSVLWTDSVQRMSNDGIATMVEIGPAKVLTALVKKINPELTLMAIQDVPSLQGLSVGHHRVAEA